LSYWESPGGAGMSRDRTRFALGSFAGAQDDAPQQMMSDTLLDAGCTVGVARGLSVITGDASRHPELVEGSRQNPSSPRSFACARDDGVGAGLDAPRSHDWARGGDTRFSS
jgi:hypothetical protein